MADDEKTPKIIEYNRNGKSCKAIDVEDLATLMLAMEEKLQIMGLGFLQTDAGITLRLAESNWQNLKGFLIAQLQEKEKEDKKK